MMFYQNCLVVARRLILVALLFWNFYFYGHYVIQPIHNNLSEYVENINFQQVKIIPANFDFTNIPAEYANSTWVIKEHHDLGKAIIKMPSDVIFKFEGGEIFNGTLNFDNSFLPINSNFSKITFRGTVIYDKINLDNLGTTNSPEDDLRNYSIFFTVLNAKSAGDIIIPEYDIYLNRGDHTKAFCRNKRIIGLSKLSKLVLTAETTVMYAENVIMENFTFENGLSKLWSGHWLLVTQSSDLTMRNIDFYCRHRPFRLSALSTTGMIKNIIIEDCNFYRSSLASGGTEPCLSINEDDQTYDMNILVQRNYFEGGDHYWGEENDIPDFATIDISGSGIRVLNNEIVNSLYNGAINMEDCNGAYVEVAHNNVYVNNVPVENAAPEYKGIGLSNSTNIRVHNNIIIGSGQMRFLNSHGINSNIRKGNAGNVYIEKNKIKNFKRGYSLTVRDGENAGSHQYFIEQNEFGNCELFVYLNLRESDVGSQISINNNHMFLNDLNGTAISFFAPSGIMNNTSCKVSGNVFDLSALNENFRRGIIAGPTNNSSSKSLNINENYVNNPKSVRYNLIRDYHYKNSTSEDADKYVFKNLNTYRSEIIDLSNQQEFLQSFLTEKREAIYDISIEYVEATSTDQGVPIDFNFSSVERKLKESSLGSYITEQNINTGTIIRKNWAELGIEKYPTISQEYLNIKCGGGKSGSGKIQIRIRTFDLEIQDNSMSAVNTANAGEDQTICQGESVTLTASGGSSYSWNTGATSKSITVSPDQTSTYKVEVSEGGVKDTDQVVVNINRVIANAGADVIITSGESTLLTASGGDSYSWNTGETTQSISVNPVENRTYTVTATKNGCEHADSVEVMVQWDDFNPPSSEAYAGDDQTICLGESAVLNASGGYFYTWSTGENSKDITVNPLRTTIYTLEAIREGVSTLDTVTVVVENCDQTEDSLNLNQSNVSIYPNPTDEFLNIDVHNINSDFDIQFISMNGSMLNHERVVSSELNFVKKIDVSKYSTGVYFVKVTGLRFSKTEKIFIN